MELLNGLNKSGKLTGSQGFIQLGQIPVTCSLSIVIERPVKNKSRIGQIDQCNDTGFVLGNFLIIGIDRCLILNGQLQEIFFCDVDTVLCLTGSRSQTNLLLSEFQIGCLFFKSKCFQAILFMNTVKKIILKRNAGQVIETLVSESVGDGLILIIIYNARTTGPGCGSEVDFRKVTFGNHPLVSCIEFTQTGIIINQWIGGCIG